MASPRRRKRGFTLVEVAVTIVILGIGLTMVMQGLNTAKLRAAQTRNFKLARDLALLTLGELESGLYREDLQDRFSGSYAEEGYPDFVFEVAMGDEQLRDTPRRDTSGPPGLWGERRAEWEDRQYGDDADEEEIAEPFEKIRIRVTFPALAEFSNELVLERWMPWEQVHGPPEDDEQSGAPGGDSP